MNRHSSRNEKITFLMLIWALSGFSENAFAFDAHVPSDQGTETSGQKIRNKAGEQKKEQPEDKDTVQLFVLKATNVFYSANEDEENLLESMSVRFFRGLGKKAKGKKVKIHLFTLTPTLKLKETSGDDWAKGLRRDDKTKDLALSKAEYWKAVKSILDDPRFKKGGANSQLVTLGGALNSRIDQSDENYKKVKSDLEKSQGKMKSVVVSKKSLFNQSRYLQGIGLLVGGNRDEMDKTSEKVVDEVLDKKD